MTQRKDASSDRIHLAEPRLNALAKRYVASCLDSNWLSQGEYNIKFESAFSKWLHAPYSTTCTNGTMALWLALKALGIGPGDEVLVPTLTFAAACSAVVMAGAVPVFVDCQESDFTMSPHDAERRMSKKTKAILLVHLYGVPCDMDAFKKIAKGRCFLIEDSAEANGSTYGGEAVGTIGDVGCFSFYANKLITTGEGGMCTTSSKEVYEKLLIYKNHGMRPDRKYWHEVSATNARMTNLHAAIGLAQMKDIDRFIKKRKELQEVYRRMFRVSKAISFPEPPKKATAVPWLTTVRVRGFSKEKLVRVLDEQGIDARPGFYPCHLMPAFDRYVQKGQRLPVAERIAPELLTLPMHPGLSAKDVVRVAQTLLKSIRV